MRGSRGRGTMGIATLTVVPGPVALLAPRSVPATARIATTSRTTPTMPRATAIPAIARRMPRRTAFGAPLTATATRASLSVTAMRPDASGRHGAFGSTSLRRLTRDVQRIKILRTVTMHPHARNNCRVVCNRHHCHTSLLTKTGAVGTTMCGGMASSRTRSVSLDRGLRHRRMHPARRTETFGQLLRGKQCSVCSLTKHFKQDRGCVCAQLGLGRLCTPINRLLSGRAVAVDMTRRVDACRPGVRGSICRGRLGRNGNRS